MADSRRKFVFRWKPVIILFVMGLFIYSFGEQTVKTYRLQKEVNALQIKIDQVKSRNASLKKTINELNTDAYIEKVAREKIGLVKQGEKVIIKQDLEQANLNSSPR